MRWTIVTAFAVAAEEPALTSPATDSITAEAKADNEISIPKTNASKRTVDFIRPPLQRLKQDEHSTPNHPGSSIHPSLRKEGYHPRPIGHPSLGRRGIPRLTGHSSLIKGNL